MINVNELKPFTIEATLKKDADAYMKIYLENKATDKTNHKDFYDDECKDIYADDLVTNQLETEKKDREKSDLKSQIENGTQDRMEKQMGKRRTP